VSAHPLAQLHDGRFGRREVDKPVASEHLQHVQIVGQPPRHAVGAHLRGQIGRVDEKHHAGYVLELPEQLTVVARDDFQSVQIVRTKGVRFFADVVIKRLPAQGREVCPVLHREHQ